MKRIILFGASLVGKYAYENLISIGITDIEYFVDNDINKTGKYLFGVEIKRPDVLLKINKPDYLVIICSMYYKEISDQLIGYGFIEDVDYVEIEQYLFNYVIENISIFKGRVSSPSTYTYGENRNKIMITLPSGFTLGGLETMAIGIYNELKKKGFDVKILNLYPETETPQDYCVFDDDVFYLEKSNSFFEYMTELCNIIAAYDPEYVISNNPSKVVLAVYILNRITPLSIRVVSVLHGNSENIYRINSWYNQYVYKFICVSHEISDFLKARIPHRIDSIYVMPNPLDFSCSPFKIHKYDKTQVRIAFAGRITVNDKRCDLLIDLITILESKCVNYQLNVAGDGYFFGSIESFVQKNNLDNKVKLLGLVDSTKMDNFYNKSDIYLNLSDSEGTCMCMLEAMKNGLVPVVTNVSGVRHFVEDGVNGFIFPTGDASKAADIIENIYHDMGILEPWSIRNRKIVEQKANIDDYIGALIGDVLK